MSQTSAWTRWVLASTLGWAATGALAAISTDLNASLGLALVAIGQWSALRRWLHGGGMWVLVTYIAGFAGSLLGVVLIGLLGWTASGGWIGAGWNLLLWAVQGAVIGAAQGFLIRREIDGVRWWVAANALGFALASPMTQFFRGGALGFEGRMLNMALFGLVSSAVSGLALVTLFREHLAE
jgi:hypothetical protein